MVNGPKNLAKTWPHSWKIQCRAAEWNYRTEEVSQKGRCMYCCLDRQVGPHTHTCPAPLPPSPQPIWAARRGWKDGSRRGGESEMMWCGVMHVRRGALCMMSCTRELLCSGVRVIIFVGTSWNSEERLWGHAWKIFLSSLCHALGFNMHRRFFFNWQTVLWLIDYCALLPVWSTSKLNPGHARLHVPIS